jgi:hypothetical protein
MDEREFVELILGEAAPTWRTCAVGWSLSNAEGDSWPITVRTALCEIPLAVTAAGIWYPCQTLAVAGVDERGRHVCDGHWLFLWTCAGCGAWLPEGNSGYCSPQCAGWANNATQTWLGQYLGARYTLAPAP